MQEIVIGVVLAGGKSSRMGRDKAHLPYRQTTLIDHAVKTLGEVSLPPDNVIVSGRAYNGNSVADLIPLAGPLGGIYSVVQRLWKKQRREQRSTRTWLMIVPVDMPFVTADLLWRLSRERAAERLLIHFQGRELPLLLQVSDVVLLVLSQCFAGKEGGKAHSIRSFIDAVAVLRPGEVFSLKATSEQEFFNMNTRADWETLTAGSN